MGEIVSWGGQYPPQPPTPGPRPVRPRQPDIRKTSHGLHLAITLIFGLFTLGVGALIWIVVWVVVAVSDGSHNRTEERRFAEQWHWYQAEYAAWQERHYAAFGRYAPDIPY